jgi:hypothetical protein
VPAGRAGAPSSGRPQAGAPADRPRTSVPAERAKAPAPAPGREVERTQRVDRRQAPGQPAGGGRSGRADPAAVTGPSAAETTVRVPRRELAAAWSGDAATDRPGRFARLGELDSETTIRIPRSSMPLTALPLQTGGIPIPLVVEETPADEAEQQPAPRVPSLLRRVPAGLLDSSLSSLGSFLMSLVAGKLLSNAGFGTYAVFYPAFITLSVIPQASAYTPAELASVAIDRPRRVELLPQSLRAGLVPALLAALFIPAVLLLPSGDSVQGSQLGFVLTAMLLVVASPTQDHIRRMLHQAGRSWSAAATSAVQVLVVGLALVIGVTVHVPGDWVPFGALGVANIVSAAYGIRKARRPAAVPMQHGAAPAARAEPPLRIRLVDLLRSSGGWMVLAGVFTTAGSFINMAILRGVVNNDAAAHGEGARVLAQPVTVLVIGLLAVLNPELMEGTVNRDTKKLIKVYGAFWALMAVVIATWIALVGFQWPFNPLPSLQPKAYAVHHLLPLTILVEGAGYSVLPLLTMVYAAGRARAATVASLVSVVVAASVTAATAKAYGPFALVWCGAATVVTIYLIIGAILVTEFRKPRPADAGGTSGERAEAAPGAAQRGPSATRRAEPAPAAPVPAPPARRGRHAGGDLRRPAAFDGRR